AGAVDLTPGAGNFSVPFSGDGDAVYLVTVGPNGTAGDLDDALVRFRVSTGQQLSINAPAFFRRPATLSASIVAGPGAGANGTFGDSDDTLEVYSIPAGVLVRTTHPLGEPLASTSVTPFVRFGAAGIALPGSGLDLAANTADDRVLAYTDAPAGTRAALTLPGVPVLAGLASGELLVYGRGGDLAADTGDEVALRIDAGAVGSQPFLAPSRWNHAFPAQVDSTRGFAIGSGPDTAVGTGDEQLLVHQTRALGAAADGSLLPLALPAAPLLATALPFVPVGPGWGLVQSPGNAVFGDADDVLVLARY
ncbi:MAG: hypothetical protein ACREID_06820, partial [Planctomycetota bacterium]